MKKIIQIIKKNIVGFILGGIVFGTTGVIGATILSSKEILYDNTSSKLNSTNMQDAIDELYEMANKPKYTDCATGYKKGDNTTTGYECKKLLCQRATTLHTETCSQTSNYCAGDGYTEGDTITYGNLGTSGTLASGDAFDCDVNGDGVYDAQTERFYYVSDMTNGVTTDSNTAVLIYYNNVSAGEPSNMAAYAYDASGSNNNGPVTAKAQLPTTSQWNNVSLTSTTRQITNQNGGTTTNAGDLHTFSYEGYAARLLTYQEVYNGCYDRTTEITLKGGLSSKCKYLMENTKYSKSSLRTYGPWLESPPSSYSNLTWDVYSSIRAVSGDAVIDANNFGVRPVIEVLKDDISY